MVIRFLADCFLVSQYPVIVIVKFSILRFCTGFCSSKAASKTDRKRQVGSANTGTTLGLGLIVVLTMQCTFACRAPESEEGSQRTTFRLTEAETLFGFERNSIALGRTLRGT